ncbi:MAG: adenylosuccinate lyase [Candidatus Azotimanducaceae bacterium]|jgi:adenylosuccinate lyase
MKLGLMLMVLASSIQTTPDTAPNATPMASLFETDYRNQQVLEVEAAMAIAQAEFGIIPSKAAQEIKRKADIRYAPADAISAEYKVVQHRMVALLNVWGASMEGDAAQYLHYGATTVDIYGTVLVLQLRAATNLLLTRLYALEAAMLRQADAHQNTVMIGRTLGQHALPITFGKKVSVWLGENRRNIERLKRVQTDLDRSGILKGAVGSYLGLGDKAVEVEQAFAQQLGLAVPYASDWHGTRDVFADYSLVLALISKSLGRVGNELFLLQMTDINETVEYRINTAVGSSTMPHKNNPSKSEALMQHSRSIPRLAEVILDDVQNYFERDNTSRPNRVLADISIESDQMLRTGTLLIQQLIVNEDVMLANIDKTRGLMLSQRLAFALAPDLGKQEANDRMHDVAKRALARQETLREAFLASDLAPLINEAQLDALLEPTTYVGLAAKQTEIVIDQIRAQRRKEGLET